MRPFVLRRSRLLPKEPAPLPDQLYDPVRQAWVDGSSGALAVEAMRCRPAASKFGETTLTEAREGVDHTANPLLETSKFGETRVTRGDEGADEYSPGDPLASQFGETTLTKAPGEGADQVEIAMPELHATGADRFGK